MQIFAILSARVNIFGVLFLFLIYSFNFRWSSLFVDQNVIFFTSSNRSFYKVESFISDEHCKYPKPLLLRKRSCLCFIWLKKNIFYLIRLLDNFILSNNCTVYLCSGGIRMLLQSNFGLFIALIKNSRVLIKAGVNILRLVFFLFLKKGQINFVNGKSNVLIWLNKFLILIVSCLTAIFRQILHCKQ